MPRQAAVNRSEPLTVIPVLTSPRQFVGPQGLSKERIALYHCGVAFPSSSTVAPMILDPSPALGSLENKMKAKDLLLLWALTLAAAGWLPGQ